MARLNIGKTYEDSTNKAQPCPSGVFAFILFALKLIVLFSLICSFASCKVQTNSEIKSMILDEEKQASLEFLFFKSEKTNQISYITAEDLKNCLFFNPEYKGCNIDSLLTEGMKGNYTFDCGVLSHSFSLDSLIESQYRKMDFKSFLYKFTVRKGFENKYIIGYQLNDTEKMSVIYYLYINDYYTVFDDYAGLYYATKGIYENKMKREDLLDPKLLK